MNNETTTACVIAHQTRREVEQLLESFGDLICPMANATAYEDWSLAVDAAAIFSQIVEAAQHAAEAERFAALGMILRTKAEQSAVFALASKISNKIESIYTAREADER